MQVVVDQSGVTAVSVSSIAPASSRVAPVTSTGIPIDVSVAAGAPMQRACISFICVVSTCGTLLSELTASDRTIGESVLPDHDLRTAMWEFTRPMLSPALVELNRDTFLASEQVDTTVGLEARRSASDLDELGLDERADPNAA